MNGRIGFILKVLVLSTVISVSIVYVGKFVSIDPNSIAAAIAVFLPTIVLALLLMVRSRSSRIN